MRQQNCASATTEHQPERSQKLCETTFAKSHKDLRLDARKLRGRLPIWECYQFVLGTPSPLLARKILKTNNLFCNYVLDL